MNSTSLQQAPGKEAQEMTGSGMFRIVSLATVAQMTSFPTFWHVLRHRAVRQSPKDSACCPGLSLASLATGCYGMLT